MRIQLFSVEDGSPIRLILPPFGSIVHGMCIGDGRLFCSSTTSATGPRVLSLPLSVLFPDDYAAEEADAKYAGLPYVRSYGHYAAAKVASEEAREREQAEFEADLKEEARTEQF